MVQEIITYAIIALTAGFVVYSLFFRKKKSAGCPGTGQGCRDCPYCNGCDVKKNLFRPDESV